jgi:hypothetical protein
MPETTFEEAKRCPKCKMPGDDVSQTVITDKELKMGKATVHMIYCRNDGCPWHNTAWSVQVNPDGTIPPPQNHRGEAKKYDFQLPDHQQRALVDNLQRQLDAEVTENAEIRGPRR